MKFTYNFLIMKVLLGKEMRNIFVLLVCFSVFGGCASSPVYKADVDYTIKQAEAHTDERLKPIVIKTTDVPENLLSEAGEGSCKVTFSLVYGRKYRIVYDECSPGVGFQDLCESVFPSWGFVHRDKNAEESMDKRYTSLCAFRADKQQRVR